MQFEKVTRPPENVLGQECPSSEHVGCKFKVPLLQQLSDLDAFLDSLFSSRILSKLQSKYKTTTNQVVKHSSPKKSPW